MPFEPANWPNGIKLCEAGLKQIIDEDGEVLNVAKQIILGNMHGYPVPLIVEAGRVCISHHNQPTFGEVFDALRK